MNVININRITKDYGSGRGVFDLSFEVKQGEVLGFLGPNGAGKTTTIRQLMGFIKPDTGSLNIYGKDCFAKSHEIHKTLGYLPGEIAFIESMKGMEFIRFVARMKKMQGLGRAEELLARFDLQPEGRLEKMSKGMKQKIGIVCAFMQDPDILILDEPTSGLDPLMQNTFVDLILEEKTRGKTVLMSSHMFEEVEKTCDRTAIIRSGKLVAVEEIEKLRRSKRKIIDIQFETAAMAGQFAASVPGAKVRGKAVTAAVGNELDSFVKRAAGYTVYDMKIRSQNLEEFFLHFYGGKDHD